MGTLDRFDIKGRSALVTGAASGIGLAYAAAMAEAGAAVTLADIDAEGAEREAARLRSEGYEVRADTIDVADWDQVVAAFDAHAKAYGGLDICFANVGIDTGAGFWNPAGHRNPDGQVDTYDHKRWERSIQVNLNGVFHTVSNAVRIMKQDGRSNGRTGGSIIATASNAGLVTEPIVGLPYMPAKAGVLHMVRALGLELAEFGIRINAIAPGPFVTNIGGGWLKKDPVARAAWDAIVPLGQVAETEQLKPLALMLASDASDYMTGSHVVIDGGMMLGKYK
ncbi:MAG: short-chain dehydrogenase [Novosphingobium sp. 16-62-11]|uniref:SDR family NAD(P)-dependent oxidoreductase n=1 Tax=Novosphingobium sp. 17-62-19 TaxID=1970406 RepID=UPI000BCC319D|nr:SDR family NAD(P)-dependent oxidoreductase [Novosphingobium sp. 17-62-19]OYX94889.1 MAG: short-chain dehydrogenase [Novosphingobium sp. 35-62-5]OYZ43315.1 MAG: short-chain dehydrogenase [Novosphingobium sp. 16-62-11]OZA20284.1 MAG: short-chain dehydrogenase [Novosphingobium sp. 17-62-19]HQS96843.1 SDR family NAD(P)-dependent oxidoreductase [Novosphingobium sp.]